MSFATPFIVKDGFLYDANFQRLGLRVADYPISSGKDVEADFLKIFRDGAKIIWLSLDDQALCDENGALRNGAALKSFDEAVETAFQYGLHLALRPFTSGRICAGRPYNPGNISVQHRYLGEIFARKNSISGKRLHEYENLALLEILFDFDGFNPVPDHEGDEFDLYCGRVLMEPFIDHYISHSVLKVYSMERGEVDAKRRATMERHAIKTLSPEAFETCDGKLRFESVMPGIRESAIKGMIRESGRPGWSGIAVSDAMSIDEHPHRNGGAEGWLTFASDSAVDIKLIFPKDVKSAKFRPSMRSPVKTRVNGREVELTLPKPRYGVLEVDYDGELPAYTIYILGDAPAEEPLDGAKLIRPGYHRLDDLKCGDAKRLYFMPGVHEIEGDKLPMESNREVCVPRGAVIRAGLMAEEISDAKIFGQGVFDGTTTPRDIGENKGSRMGEKWMDDAGREGFVYFFKGEKIVFDGPVIYNSNFWNIVIAGTKDCAIRNHKAITWLQNTDGIQPRSCVDLLVENCFLKCADDCVAIKTRRTLGMESRRIVMRKLVLWHDRVGSGLEIGHTSQADLLEDVKFEDIEAVYGGGGGHAVGMCVIDHSTVRNVVYDGIYVEGRDFDCDFAFVVTPTYYTTDKERGRIKGVVVRNFLKEGGPSKGRSYIKGFDEEHLVEDISFEKIRWHCGSGKEGRDAKDLSEFLKECVFARNINIR